MIAFVSVNTEGWGALIQDKLILTSLQAGVLVLMVLGIQGIFHRQLRPKWRYALWWVVVLKLMLPWVPESSWSVFNWVKAPMSLSSVPDCPPAENAAAVPMSTSHPGSKEISADPASRPNLEKRVEALPQAQGQVQGELDHARPLSGESPVLAAVVSRTSVAWDLVMLFGTVWWGVVILLGAGVWVRWIRFSVLLRQNGRPVQGTMMRIFEDCKSRFGLITRVELIETRLTESPALFGLVRPRLLLPVNMVERFNEEELRYIFLHELAHLKRGDLWQNCLITALQVVHWFNPLIWFGFMRMRADREVACDEMALRHSGAMTGEGYGNTVVKLLEQIQSAGAVPGGVGILEDRNQMRRRIRMIVQYRPHRTWSVFAMVLLILVGWVSLTDAQSPGAKLGKAQPSRVGDALREGEAEGVARKRIDLKGVVETKDGDPLPEVATVLIATASPKVGTSTLCPSCYADCRKRAKANPDGEFVIEGLDAELKFEVLAVAKGYKPKSLSGVEPSKGPVRLALDPIESSDLKPDQTLRGRVLDPKGQALEGVLVEMEGTQGRNGGGSWGQLNGIDPRAVTDEKGEFVITSKKPFEMMTVKVVARGFAPRKFLALASGGVQHDLTVTEGVSVKGRVVSDSVGLEGVSVGVCGVDRSVEAFLGCFDVGTGKDGGFELVNLPAEGEYYVYGIMKSLGAQGAIPIQKIKLGKDGTTTDVGVLELKPAFTVSGRVEFSDGSKVPPKTRIMLSRDDAWDSMQVSADEDGRFQFAGVPGEIVSLNVRRRGWKLAEENYSLDQLNPYSLVGRVDGSNTQLVVRLVPGEPSRNPRMPVRYDYAAAKNKALHGTEWNREEATGWKWAGRVLDSETMQPISQFQVGVGNLEAWGRFQWEDKKKVQSESGQFALNVRKDMPQPAVRIEADGYLPLGETVLPRDQSALEFKLKKGSGPKGKVVYADGAPAEFVKVVQLGGGYNWVGLDGVGHLTTYSQDELMQETDEDGSFEFKPQLEVSHVLVFARKGFGLVSTTELQKQPTLRLEPYGRIQGRLMRGTEAVTNADLEIAFAESMPIQINSMGLAVTDHLGRYAFSNVPPTKIMIRLRQYEAGVRSRWSSANLEEVEVKPGQTSTVDLKGPEKLEAPPMNIEALPSPVRIPGVELKGVVVGPDGKPVMGAEVALQVPGRYLAVGRGKCVDNLREIGLLDITDAEGKFRIPMCEGVRSLIAVSEAGIAHLSVAEVKSEGTIRLGKWAEIHGTFMIGQKVGANRKLRMEMKVAAGDNPALLASKDSAVTARPELDPMQLDFASYGVAADKDGKFIFSFVPPGTVVIQEAVPMGTTGASYRWVRDLEIQSGETKEVVLGAFDQAVKGKCVLGAGEPGTGFQKAVIILREGMGANLLARWMAATNEQQRARLAAIPEFQKAFSRSKTYWGRMDKDGSFAFEAIAPGEYELMVQNVDGVENRSAMSHVFTPSKPFVIPQDASHEMIDWGELILRQVHAKE